jgi:hypothetical protein
MNLQQKVISQLGKNLDVYPGRGVNLMNISSDAKYGIGFLGGRDTEYMVDPAGIFPTTSITKKSNRKKITKKRTTKKRTTEKRSKVKK